MTAIHTTEDQQAIHMVKRLAGLAIGLVIIALGAGAALLAFDPASGSTSEAALGLTAAVAGIGVAGATIGALLYAQVKNLWRFAPKSVRVLAWAVVIFAIASTLWNLIVQAS